MNVSDAPLHPPHYRHPASSEALAPHRGVTTIRLPPSLPLSFFDKCPRASSVSKFRCRLWQLANVIPAPTGPAIWPPESALRHLRLGGNERAHPVAGRTRRSASAWPQGGRLRSRPSPAKPGLLGSGWPVGRGHGHKRRC